MRNSLVALFLMLLLASAGFAQDAPAEPKPERVEEPEEEPKQSKGEVLVEQIAELFAQRDQQRALLKDATGNDRLALEEQEWRTQLEVHDTVCELTERIVGDPEGPDAVAYRERLVQLWERSIPAYDRALAHRQERTSKLRSQAERAEPAEHLALEQALSEEEGRLQGVFAAQLEALDAMDSLGLDTSRARLAATAMLRDRAETLAGRLRVSSTSKLRLVDQIKKQPDSAEFRAQLAILEERLTRAKSHLANSTTLLESQGIDTAEYRQILIESTGEITADVFDPEVALGLFEAWREQLGDRLREHGPGWLVKALLVLLVLLAFRLAASITRRLVRRSLNSSRVHVSQLLEQTLISWSSRLVMIIGLLVAISQVGIEIGPLLAGLGIAGFVIGFALQDSLSNFAAGAMILMYRPFDVGDVIEAAGVSGAVREMSLVSTTIHTFDNQTLIVPNTKLWGDVIRNVTAQRTRRIDLTVMTAYAEDVDRVDAVLRDIVSGHEKVLAAPTPLIEVHRLADSGVEFVVRPWVKTEDYWPTYWALTREIKRRFDREGISIPFPQRDVHHHYEDGAPPA
jgi:small conductance mechanosensitive channel